MVFNISWDRHGWALMFARCPGSESFFCEIPQARTPQNGFYVMVFRLFGARYGMPIESFRMSQECQYFQAFIRFWGPKGVSTWAGFFLDFSGFFLDFFWAYRTAWIWTNPIPPTERKSGKRDARNENFLEFHRMSIFPSVYKVWGPKGVSTWAGFFWIFFWIFLSL